MMHHNMIKNEDEKSEDDLDQEDHLNDYGFESMQEQNVPISN